MTWALVWLLVLLTILVVATVVVLWQKARLLNARRFTEQGEGLLVSAKIPRNIGS